MFSFTVILLLLAGFSATISLLHLIIGLSTKENRNHLLFFGATIVAPIYILATVELYAVETVSNYFSIIKLQMFCISFLLILYPRFIAKFTNNKAMFFLNIQTALFIIFPLVRLFHPFALTYDSVDSIYTQTLPWGETLNLLKGTLNIWAYLYFILIVSTMVYTVILSVQHMKKEKKVGRDLTIIHSLFILTIANDVAVDIFSLNWIYLGEFGLGLAITLMGFYMANDLIKGLLLKEEIAKKEKVFKTIINNSQTAIYMKDKELRFTVVNDYTCALLKKSQEEIIGKKVEDLTRPQIAKIFTDNDLVVLKNKEAIQVEELLVENEKEYCFLSKKVPYFDKDGAIQGIIGISDDITTQKALEKKLLQSDKMGALGQLAGGIAHDFKNQLTGIIGMASLLKVDQSYDDEAVNGILEAGKSSYEQIKQLLLFARSGDIQKGKISLSSVVQSAFSIIRTALPSSIKIEHYTSVDDLDILGDKSQLQNALINLIINSKDAMPDGGTITIALSKEQVTKKSSEVLDLASGMYGKITLEDTGIGMPKSIQKHIFEPFFTTKEAEKGTGLGLSAVYGTIQGHGGEIRVHSDIGKGTLFEIYLPLIKE